MNLLQKLIAHLAEIFSPLIPAIIVGGLILGFRNIIGDIKLLEDGTRTIVESSQFFSGLHSFLWLIGEAIFNFLPVGITWSISKKNGNYTDSWDSFRYNISFTTTFECVFSFKWC